MTGGSHLLKPGRPALIFPLIILLLFSSWPAESLTAPLPPPAAIKPRAILSLGPGTATYEMAAVRRGAVAFTATITNQGDSPIIIAHPTVCVPAGHQAGTPRHLADLHGRSEILLLVKKPDNGLETLRDGFHFFDPDGRNHFSLAPGQTGGFRLGWFFANARGRWEDDRRAATLFRSKGLYRIKLLFRNQLPEALIYDPAGANTTRRLQVWTGEMESAEVIVVVR